MIMVHEFKQAIFLTRLACYGFLLFALVWWLAAVPSLDWPARVLLDISVWPIDGSHDKLNRDARFLSAIGAGLLTAMALLILFVVIPELEQGNKSVLRGTTMALLAWYVIDCAGCITAGVASNAILNTFYILVILVPLFMVGRAMKKEESR